MIYAQPVLTVEDEFVMWEMIEKSHKKEEIDLFLKIFPYSPHRRELKGRLLRIENRETISPDALGEEEIPLDKKAEIVDDGLWARFEIGRPTPVLLKSENGLEIKTKPNPAGYYVGWSHEIGADIGFGAGYHYFVVEAEEEDFEFVHSFYEIQCKGRLFDFINYGFSYGTGTTLFKSDSWEGMTSAPGFNSIRSASLGISGRHIGFNAIYSAFTGSSGLEYPVVGDPYVNELKWTGEMITVTVEWVF